MGRSEAGGAGWRRGGRERGLWARSRRRRHGREGLRSRGRRVREREQNKCIDHHTNVVAKSTAKDKKAQRGRRRFGEGDDAGRGRSRSGALTPTPASPSPATSSLTRAPRPTLSHQSLLNQCRARSFFTCSRTLSSARSLTHQTITSRRAHSRSRSRSERKRPRARACNPRPDGVRGAAARGGQAGRAAGAAAAGAGRERFRRRRRRPRRRRCCRSSGRCHHRRSCSTS